MTKKERKRGEGRGIERVPSAVFRFLRSRHWRHRGCLSGKQDFNYVIRGRAGRLSILVGNDRFFRPVGLVLRYYLSFDLYSCGCIVYFGGRVDDIFFRY